MHAGTEILRQLVFEEIERIVEDARRAGCPVHAGHYAGLLLACYPGANFTAAHIVGELVLAAGRAGVSVEVGEMTPKVSSLRPFSNRQ